MNTELKQALTEAISVKMYFESLKLQDKTFSEVNDLLELNEITLSVPGYRASIITNSYSFDPYDDYSQLYFEFELGCEVDGNEYSCFMSFFDMEYQTEYEVDFSTANDYGVNLSFNHDGTYKLEVDNRYQNYTYDKDRVVKHFIDSKVFDLEKDTDDFNQLHLYLKLQEKGKGELL